MGYDEALAERIRKQLGAAPGITEMRMFGGLAFLTRIAWFNDGQRSALTLDFKDAGTFIWDQHLLTGLPVRRKEARISDHYPLWAEFGIPSG